jgi:heme-degrading monooxygenase HmoA
MSIVRINAITVPEGGGGELERRFAARAGNVDRMDGFQGFELLRPTDDSNRYFVMTHWRDEPAFVAWVNSRAFADEHARATPPVAKHSELLAFDVVEL